MKQEVQAIIKLHLEFDAEDDACTEIITLLQAFADFLLSPVEIVDLKEEADIYGNREHPPLKGLIP